jgi:hypothetical protein
MIIRAKTIRDIIAEKKKIVKSWKRWKKYLRDYYAHIMTRKKYTGTRTDVMVFK